MTQKQLDKIEEIIYNANNTPINRMSCFICDHCSVYKGSMRCYCNYHHYFLLDAQESICFNFRPLKDL